MTAPISTPSPDPYTLDHGSTSYRVDRYELDLDVRLGSNKLIGKAVLQCTALEAATHIVLDLVGLRASKVHVDGRNEKLGYRIREAQMSKIPYEIVVGDQEVENGTVNVRHYGVEGSQSMTVQELLDKIDKEIKERKSVA